MRIDETGTDTLDSADAADVAEQRAELDDRRQPSTPARATTCRSRRIRRTSPSRNAPSPTTTSAEPRIRGGPVDQSRSRFAAGVESGSRAPARGRNRPVRAAYAS